MKIMIKKRFKTRVIVITMLFSLFSAFASNAQNADLSIHKSMKLNEIQIGSKVLIQTANGIQIAIIESFSGEVARVRYQVFKEDTNRFIRVKKHTSELIGTKSISNMGFTIGQTVCLKDSSGIWDTNESGEITEIFKNNMIEVTFGDFFGYRFLIFERPELFFEESLTKCN